MSRTSAIPRLLSCEPIESPPRRVAKRPTPSVDFIIIIMTKLSRRELARIAAGVTAARAIRLDAQAPSAYVGPLTGVEKGLEDRRFDPVAFTVDLYAAAPRR